MATSKKIIHLTWTNPETQKIIQDYGAISLKEPAELTAFILKHPNDIIECHCQKNNPIPMLKAANPKRVDQKQYYHIRNYPHQGNLHDPNCLYYTAEKNSAFQETETGIYQAFFSDFKYNPSTTKKNSSDPLKESNNLKNPTFQTFANQLLLNANSFALYQALSQKKQTPPNWQSLFQAVPHLLSKTFYYKDNLCLGDFYLPIPRGPQYKDHQIKLQSRYLATSQDYRFFTHGRILEIISISNPQPKNQILLKVQTQKLSQTDAVSYLWVDKTSLPESFLKNTSSAKEEIWWYMGLINPTPPHFKTTLRIKDKPLTFAFPKLEQTYFTSLALSGIPVENTLELTYFNNCFKQHHFIKKTFSPDKYSPVKSSLLPTFLKITPSKIPGKRYDYLMGQISHFTGLASQFKHWEKEENQRLACLKQEKFPLWHWDTRLTDHWPPF